MTLLLKNASIADGSGNQPFRGDILIDGEKISAIGNLPKGHAKRVIDCQGATAAPGFIDVHGNADHHLNAIRFPDQDHYLSQGITSAVMGHGGASLAPFFGALGFYHHFEASGVNTDWRTTEELVSALRRRPLGINFGSLAGMGSLMRTLPQRNGRKSFDIAKEAARRAVNEGALGVSFVYGALAKHERRELFKLAHAQGAACAIHFENGHGEGVQEILALKPAERPRILLENIIPPFASPETYALLLPVLNALQEAGVYAEIEPGEFTVMPVAKLLPAWAEGERREAAQEKLHDEWLRGKIANEMPEIDPGEVLVVHGSPAHPFIGLTLREIMRAHNVKGAREGLLYLMETTRMKAVVRIAKPAHRAFARILECPNVLVGSRELGSYPSHWRNMELARGFLSLIETVLREGTMPLETLVKRLTADAAALYGIRDRGMLKEGMIADIAVLRGHELKHVIVRGELAIEDGAYTNMRNGRPLVHIRSTP